MRSSGTRALVALITIVGLVLGTVASAAAMESTDAEPQPTIGTNKDDYLPGETVAVHGGGWQPGETVALAVAEVGGSWTWGCTRLCVRAET